MIFEFISQTLSRWVIAHVNGVQIIGLDKQTFSS